jgi:hypothetical protein
LKPKLSLMLVWGMQIAERAVPRMFRKIMEEHNNERQQNQELTASV